MILYEKAPPTPLLDRTEEAMFPAAYLQNVTVFEKQVVFR